MPQDDKDTKPAPAADETTKPDSEDTSSSKTEELDLDKEIEEEEKRGKPDKGRAAEAFRDREARRETQPKDDDKEDSSKPVTQADLERMRQEAEAGAYQRLQQDRALEIARRLAGNSEKAAQLIYLKWRNRNFPQNMSLDEQLNEAYAITYSKRIIAERDEAMRAAAGKSTAGTDGAAAHRDGPQAGEPNLPDADKAAIVAAGFKWDSSKRIYVKPLGRRGNLYRDPKTGKTWQGA